MSEQPRSALEEAAWLVDTLRRRIGGGGGGGAKSDDVWSDAVRDDWGDHFATGAPECRYCPICRAMAATRSSGPDIVENLVGAGGSLIAAAREAMAGFERTRPADRPADHRDRHSGSADDPVDIG
jgi:hypothetical protein